MPIRSAPLTSLRIVLLRLPYRVLRAVNGSLNWLSSQSRPDLSVQTSLSQLSLPRPTMPDFRRTRQESDLGITFKPIPLDQLTISCHSGAAWANVGAHTSRIQYCLCSQRVTRWEIGGLVSSNLEKLQAEQSSQQHFSCGVTGYVRSFWHNGVASFAFGRDN